MSDVKAHVLVCGSSFGALHARAVSECPHLHLAGVYASGSRRSKNLAAYYGVPLYTSADELPCFNDGLPTCASVVLRSSVLGGSAQEVAHRLVEKGWDILLEPPVHADELTSLAKEARHRGAKVSVGNLYARLAAVEAFQKITRELVSRKLVSSMDVFVSSHVVYYLMAMLGMVLPGKGLKVLAVDHCGPYVNVNARLGSVPLNMHVYNQADSRASDAYSHLFFKVSATTSDGILQLAEVCGPVTWYPRLAINGYSEAGMPLTEEGIMPHEVVFEAEQQCYDRWISRAWTRAIAQDMMCFVELDNPGSSMPALMLDAKNWTAATQAIGFPSPVQESREASITLDDIKTILA